MYGKVGMDTAQSDEKVIFERADGLFRRIHAMGVGQNEQKINIFVA